MPDERATAQPTVTRRGAHSPGSLRVLAAKELQEAFQSRQVAVVAAVTALLLGLGLFLMVRDYGARLENYDLIRPDSTSGTADASDSVAPVAVVRPNPLSVLARGLDDAMGRSFELSVVLVTIGATQAAANDLFALVRPPDPLFLTHAVLSLVALLAAFDLICGEKEAGTLKLLLAAGVSRGRLLLGKLAGGLAGLLLPYAAVSVAGLLVLALVPGLRLTGEQWLRAALFFAVGALYLAFFFALGLAISSRVERSTSALVLGLFAWVVLVFAVPAVATLTARQISATPPVEELQVLRNQAFERGMIQALAAQRDLPPSASSAERREIWREGWRKIVEENEAISERYRRPLGRLVRLARDLSRISPAASYVHAATAIAGTGIDDEIDLKARVIDHWGRIFPVLAARTLGRSDETGEPPPPLPTFEYERRSLGEVLSGPTLYDLAWLALATALLVVAAARSLDRYDVR
jgi:ABC-type transport system involved in multi-copper enzyme maturation permease subunit